MDTNIIKKIIEFYLSKGKNPEESDIELSDTIIEKPSFVTLYKAWKIVWNSWNIKENTDETFWETLVWNIIESTDEAKIEQVDLENLKIRVDFIEEKNKLTWKKKIKDINPNFMWIIAIKSDYSSAWVILPNISDKISSWDDLEKAIKSKIKWFKEEDFIIYELKTSTITNF